jgi:hypothetical protein
MSLFFFKRYIEMEQKEYSYTSAQKIQTPGIHPKEIIQYSQHGEKFEIKDSHTG